MKKSLVYELYHEMQDSAKEYKRLLAPANEAHAKYMDAVAAHKEAVLYEKVKRQVMEDLMNNIGNIKG